ncbi:MAG: hypothetical protein IKM27_06615 [Clostridia bacterium]|nr:hypothetical protein [Clostridia bacterium]
MEVKKSKRTAFSLWLIPASYAFSHAFYYLTAFFLVPLIGELIPPVYEHFYELNKPENYEALMRFDSLVYLLCSFAAFFPATAIAFIFSRKARDLFIADTKGLIGYKEGIKYHISKYCIPDTVFLALLYFVLGFPRLLNMRTMFRFVPLTNGLNMYFGFIIGWILFVVIGYAVSLYGAFVAQRKWRANFLSE